MGKQSRLWFHLRPLAERGDYHGSYCGEEMPPKGRHVSARAFRFRRTLELSSWEIQVANGLYLNQSIKADQKRSIKYGVRIYMVLCENQ